MKRLFIPAMFVSLCATSASAQTGAAICDALGRITTGQWAEYAITAAGETGMTLRAAVVGNEAVDGADHYWIEMNTVVDGNAMVIQFLVPEYPYQPADVVRAVMKLGQQPAMEVSGQMLMMMQQRQASQDFSSDAKAACTGATEVGWENLAVAGQTIRSLHLTYGSNEENYQIWVSEEIPFGLIKLTSDQGNTVELKSFGRDAKSSITETPQKLPGFDH